MKRQSDPLQEPSQADQDSTATEAEVHGSGAIAQGEGAVAAGAGGTAISITIVHQGVEVTIPSAEAVARHRAALRERLAADAHARWGGMSVYIQEEGATLPVEASPYQTGRLGRRENLLQTLHIADRLLVLGEPGSGKTVSLERLAWEACAGAEPVVPVLVRLFRYDGTPLADWVRALLQRTGHLRLDGQQALTAFLKEEAGRCLFLFDGLNEVPPPYRDRLVGELVRWISSYPRHPVILTSRPQDELWRRLREEAGRTVVVRPIGDEQAQAYLVAHLGERGIDLYGQLDRRLRELVRTPLILWLVKEAGAEPDEKSMPGNRGELYARFVSRMLQRDTDRRMDSQIPERVKRQALSGLAYHLGQEQRLSCSRDEAVAVMTRVLGEEQEWDVAGACARHGLLAGDDPVWFAPHQTVQEHFAALTLREIAKEEWSLGRWAQLKRTGRRLLTGQEEGLARLAADDWWMETFVQLAGLVDDTDRLVTEVLRVNPWLAWWCVEEGQDVAEGTRETVADRSMGLLDSEQVADRRRAVATLGRMRSGRAAQPLLRAAADPDEEVAELAMQALAEMGEAARTSVEGALRGTDRRLWRVALRYLAMRLDDPLCAEVPDKVWEEVLGLPMVWVPPGPFLMGSDKEKDADARDNELPQHEVTLPGYWIGRYPVTVAQFGAFVEASSYPGVEQARYLRYLEEAQFGAFVEASSYSLEGMSDHPVVYVRWYDALAFCVWLSRRTGILVTLPSEAEWEKAARGTDGRVYPWVDDEWDVKRCNASQAGEEGTTPVGFYSPQGDSPYGCADMAGNVWEWTRSLWGERGTEPDFRYPYSPSDGRENLAEMDMLRVLRGGSFDDGARFARCAFRTRFGPDHLHDHVGFRVVVASPVHL